MGSTSMLLSGCGLADRPRRIRLMPMGSVAVLQADDTNQHDKQAVSVIWRDRQIGWIPAEAALSVRRLKVATGVVQEVGTDPDGQWSRVRLRVQYPLSECTAEERSHGLLVAGILTRMKSKSAKSVQAAKEMADMRPSERGVALDAWLHAQLEAPKARRKKTP